VKYKDYYAALGVPVDADLAQIKKAYRKLARLHHPDVSKASGAEARFKEAAEAYATLKDPEKRAAYDELGRRPPGEEFSAPPQCVTTTHPRPQASRMPSSRTCWQRSAEGTPDLLADPCLAMATTTKPSRERRTCVEGGRHRRGDGCDRYRGGEGRGPDDPGRRQLRDHRRGRESLLRVGCFSMVGTLELLCAVARLSADHQQHIDELRGGTYLIQINARPRLALDPRGTWRLRLCSQLIHQGSS
jgi:curved DNA-binding protein CbpA